MHLGWDKVFKIDDIESYIYLMVKLAEGALPWSEISATKSDNFFEIFKWKMKVTADELCRRLPKAFKKIYEYSKEADFKQNIDYDFIEDSLREAAKESGFTLQVNLHNFWP
jgi:hypothetical protein